MKDVKILPGFFVMFMIVCLSIILVKTGWNRESSTENRQQLRQILLMGEADIDGYGWNPLEDSVSVDVYTYHTVKVRGHFSEDIAQNEQLLFWLSNVLFSVRINGSLLYSLEPSPNQFLKSPGNGWAGVISPGITTEDLVEIELSNVYTFGNPETFSGFFESIYAGSEIGLSRHLTRQYGVSVLLSFVMSISGILIAVVGLSIQETDRKSIIFLGLFSVAMGIWNLIDFHYINLFFQSTAVLTTISQISQFLLPVFLANFLLPFLSGKRKLLLNIFNTGSLLLLFISTFLQVLGIRDFYEFNLYDILLLSATYSIVPFLILGEALKKKEKSVWNLFYSVTPLCILVIAELNLYSQGRYFSAVFVKAGYMIMILIQFYYFIKKITLQRNQALKANQLEQELTQNRISLMLSQIQPHFLFNTLASIRALCTINPLMAQETIDEFSDYLRGNLNSLTQNYLIPFSQEMQLVKAYLAIEQKRFGIYLNVIYDLQFSDFFIPSLTLQPIVENAVRHGITKKETGGTLVIHTEKAKDGVLIRITDDGVGFDPNRPPEEERLHLGVENVRGRLSAMCSGTMEIKSCIGEGTTVIISLP